MNALVPPAFHTFVRFYKLRSCLGVRQIGLILRARNESVAFIIFEVRAFARMTGTGRIRAGCK